MKMVTKKMLGDVELKNGMMVEVRVPINCYETDYIVGRIKGFDESGLVLDCSTLYKSNVESYYWYHQVYSIKVVDIDDFD